MNGQEVPSRENSDAQQALATFWQRQLDEMRGLGPIHFKQQELPLARIKKIMKIDEDVRMISSEAPLLFAKAAQIFITELTLRAWIHTEDSKRRTLQRNDIAMAITKFDQFDFLIDIVPREEIHKQSAQGEAATTTAQVVTAQSSGVSGAQTLTVQQPATSSSNGQPVQYYVTLSASDINGQGQQVVIQQPN